MILCWSWPLSHAAAPLAVFGREGCMSTTQYVRNSRKKIHQNTHAPLPSHLAEPDKAVRIQKSDQTGVQCGNCWKLPTCPRSQEHSSMPMTTCFQSGSRMMKHWSTWESSRLKHSCILKVPRSIRDAPNEWHQTLFPIVCFRHEHQRFLTAI